MIKLIAAAIAGLWVLNRATPNGQGVPRPGAANYSEQANSPAAPDNVETVLHETADSAQGGTEDAIVYDNDGKK